MVFIRLMRHPVRSLFLLGLTIFIFMTAYLISFYVKDQLRMIERKKAADFIHDTKIRLLDVKMQGSGNQDQNKNTIKAPTGQACVHPQLELWHPALKDFFKDNPTLQCAEEENWVYVDNGTFKISPNAIKSHGEIECKYKPLMRGKDDFTVLRGETIAHMKDGSPLKSDFFEVSCQSGDSKSYNNIHSGIAYNSELHSRSSEIPMPKEALGLDVLMFGFDSLSRMTWMRNLPKTHEYLTQSLDSVILEGYNIVGDGTPQALLPILTGKSEPDLPEARRGIAKAKTVDNHPWIWKDMKKTGYVTQWGEDGSNFGTFTYRMLGFKDAPVDHYMRPFCMELENAFRSKNKRFCLGSVPKHLNMMHWVRDFFNMYTDKPKFSFLFHSEYTHDGYSQVKVADDDIKQFLESLEESGFLNNTLLILMSDHGARFQAVRQSVQGKYEERMPFFSVRVPPWFKTAHPKAYNNLKANAKKLTTPYDIHATFKHILNFSKVAKESVNKREMSLFNEIPSERTCEHAGIDAHWCACLNWERAATSHKHVLRAGDAIVDLINSYTEPHRSVCHKLELMNISSAYLYLPNQKLVKFKKSKDSDGRVADLSDNMSINEVFLQITLETSPGGGKFEATVRANSLTSQYLVSDRQISRINKYGSAPHCVASQHPRLRPYCYCKEQLSQIIR